MSNDIQSIGSLVNMWLREPNWAEDVTTTYKQSMSLMQYGGSVGSVWVENFESPMRLQYSFRNHDKSDEKEILDFFEGRLGRHGNFWIPTWITNFEVVDNIVASDTIIKIKNDEFNTAYQGYERIAFILTNGDIVVRQITKVEIISDAQENITVSSIINRSIPMTSIALCCLFVLGRYENDSFEFAYTTDSVSDVKVNFYELIREYP